ncbi:hypothetical protein Tco_0814952 [Tanacetum coccineum]
MALRSQAPPSPVYLPYVPEPVYSEYIPPEDDVFLAEEQPLPAATSPTADSPRYIPEFDPERDLKEDDEEDPEEDPVNYPANRRDDDNDDDDNEEEEDKEEEEHLAPADYTVVALPVVDHVPSEEETEPFETDECAATPPSPPSPLLPHIPSPPFPASPPASPIRPLGYRAAMIRLRAETPSTSHPLPLPTSSPPLQLLSSDHRTDRPEITLPPRKRLGIDLGPRYEIGESSAAAATRPIGGRRADYRIKDVWIDPREAVEEVAPMTLEGVNARVTELTAVQEQDTQDIYAVIEDTQDRQTQIYQSVETLFDDNQYHYEAWGRSIEVSYMTRSEIMTLHYVVMGQQAVISQLQAADRRSQVVTSEMLQADHHLLSIMGYSQLADCIDLLFCLATQYRSFVQAMIDEGVTATLAARDVTRNGDDSHTSGTGARRPVEVARECTYSNFLKCQPLNFKGIEGVVGLTQWFEKIESVHSISNCTTTTPEAAHAMPWRTLKKTMTNKYCPRGEIKKLEFEM